MTPPNANMQAQPALALAFTLASALEAHGYPFLAVEVETKYPYPMVALWDDQKEIIRYIACCEPQSKDTAYDYAEMLAMAEWGCGFGASGHVLTVGGDTRLPFGFALASKDSVSESVSGEGG